MPVFPAPGGGDRALKFQARLEPHSTLTSKTQIKIKHIFVHLVDSS